MDARPFSVRQSKLLKEASPLWAARLGTLASETELQGGMRWKSVRDRDYLIRYWTDPATGLKLSKSLGRRSDTTETVFASFKDKRAEFQAEKAVLDLELSAWAGRVRQLDIGRMSPFVSALYRELHRSNIAGVRLIDRDTHLPQSIYLGSELLDVPAIDPFELGRHATVVLVPDNVDMEAVADAAVRCERGLDRTGHMILGHEGTRVVAMLVQVPHLVGWAVRYGSEEQGKALLRCLDAPPIDAIVPDADDLPLLVSSVPPAATVLMAFCALNTMHIERHAILEDYAVGMAELLLDRDDPLMSKVIRAVPELMDRMQIGGHHGFKI